MSEAGTAAAAAFRDTPLPFLTRRGYVHKIEYDVTTAGRTYYARIVYKTEDDCARAGVPYTPHVGVSQLQGTPLRGRPMELLATEEDYHRMRHCLPYKIPSADGTFVLAWEPRPPLEST